MEHKHNAQHQAINTATMIRTALHAVPVVLHDIEPAPHPPQYPRTTERLLPISEKVINAKHHLKATLMSWALMVTEESGYPPTYSNNSPAIAAWLTTHADWLSNHDAAQDMIREVESACRTLQEMTYRQPPPHLMGICLECHTPVYARADEGQYKKCHACGSNINIHEIWNVTVERIRNEYARASEIARLLSARGERIKPEYIRVLGSRGKLTGYCDIEEHATYWRIGDVIDHIRVSERTTP